MLNKLYSSFTYKYNSFILLFLYTYDMGKAYQQLKSKFTVLISTFLLIGNTVFADSLTVKADTIRPVVKKSATKITDTRADKPLLLKNGVKANFVPFKPVQDPSQKSIDFDGDKIINNVKVYPNPVSDQLNLTYHVSKDSNVTIKVMDVLGNEVTTLLSQRMSAGEQSNSFSIASRLNSGFYFIRFIVGNETIVKRISVL